MARGFLRLRSAGLLVSASLLVFLAPQIIAQTRLERAAAPGVATRTPAIVIGFVGGFVKHDDPVYGTVRLAARLRAKYPSGVVVRVFENHHEKSALSEVLRLLSANGNGTLSSADKQDARIIIFGHSWGGSETVTLARQLQSEGIPVLLTVQVDSVRKFGEEDSVIPANVEEAANFYQPSGIIRGEPKIRAANPEATEILGNFRFDYEANPLSCGQYPLHDRIFMKTHMEMDCDPRVWTKVESLIRSKLPEEAHGL
jgi:hypothetical protein